jgi:hypothetical protein
MGNTIIMFFNKKNVGPAEKRSRGHPLTDMIEIHLELCYQEYQLWRLDKRLPNFEGIYGKERDLWIFFAKNTNEWVK